MFNAAFAFTYAAYGYSFLLSVLMAVSSAQMVSVLMCFAWWFLSGLEPALEVMAYMFEDYRALYAVALSPVRWASGYLFTFHFERIQDQQFRNPLVRQFLSIYMQAAAMDIEQIEESNTTDWNCATRPLTVRNRWSGEEVSGFGDRRLWGHSIGFNCNLKHLCFLGLSVRMLTVVIHTALCKVNSRGGGALFMGKGHKGFFSNTFSPTVNSLFWTFLLNVWFVQVVILLDIP